MDMHVGTTVPRAAMTAANKKKYFDCMMGVAYDVFMFTHFGFVKINSPSTKEASLSKVIVSTDYPCMVNVDAHLLYDASRY